MSKDESDAPLTAGQLRRRIAHMGLKWQVDPRLRDDDQLIDYPRGGIMEEHIAGAERHHDLAEYLRRVLPANPFLQARWRELGLLKRSDAVPRQEGSARVESDRGGSK
jgi:hypothetical protein